MAIPQFSDGPVARPTKQGGESNVAWRQQGLDWLGQQAGVRSGADVGLPAPSVKFGGVGSTQLGGFDLGAPGSLPPPTYTSPTGPLAPPGVSSRGDSIDPAYDYERNGPPVAAAEASQALGEAGAPSLSGAPFFAAPSGTIGSGLRAPRDASPSEARRDVLLAATGFDVGWGTPPAISGLRWSPIRLLYEGVPAQSPGGGGRGAIVATKGAAGYFLQAILGTSWTTRWVRVFTSAPSLARPYEAVSRDQANALNRDVDFQLISFDTGASVRKNVDTRAAYVPAVRAPTRGPASAYVWVPSSMLPAGMPISGFSEIPVPRADYYSGAWRAPGYRPAIPLPVGYERVQFVPPAPYAGPLVRS